MFRIRKIPFLDKRNCRWKITLKINNLFFLENLFLYFSFKYVNEWKNIWDQNDNSATYLMTDVIKDQVFEWNKCVQFFFGSHCSGECYQLIWFDFSEISKNTFLYRTPLVTASVAWRISMISGNLLWISRNTMNLIRTWRPYNGAGGRVQDKTNSHNFNGNEKYLHLLEKARRKFIMQVFFTKII